MQQDSSSSHLPNFEWRVAKCPTFLIDTLEACLSHPNCLLHHNTCPLQAAVVPSFCCIGWLANRYHQIWFQRITTITWKRKPFINPTHENWKICECELITQASLDVLLHMKNSQTCGSSTNWLFR